MVHRVHMVKPWYTIAMMMIILKMTPLLGHLLAVNINTSSKINGKYILKKFELSKLSNLSSEVNIRYFF